MIGGVLIQLFVTVNIITTNRLIKISDVINQNLVIKRIDNIENDLKEFKENYSKLKDSMSDIDYLKSNMDSIKSLINKTQTDEFSIFDVLKSELDILLPDLFRRGAAGVDHEPYVGAGRSHRFIRDLRSQWLQNYWEWHEYADSP